MQTMPILCEDVLLLIIEYLEPSSLHSLRLVNHRMKQACEPRFAQSFGAISVLLHQQSLEEFAALSENSTYNILVHRVDILITWFTNEDDLALLGFMSTDAERDIFQRYISVQNSLTASGQDQFLLTKGLQGFMNCQTIRIVEVGTGYALGAKSVPRDVFHKPPISFDGRLAYTVGVVLLSLCQIGALRGYSLRTFDVLASHDLTPDPAYLSPELSEEWMPLDGFGGVDGLNIGELGRLVGGLEQLQPAFSSLFCLKLRLGGYWKGKPPKEFTALAQIIASTRHLARLDLRFDTSASPLFKPLLRINPPCHLSEIKLAGLHTTIDVLGIFLRQYQNSLRRLTLCHISLEGRDEVSACKTWTTVFLLLGNEFKLETLHLHCLTSSSTYWFWFSINFSHSGRTQFVAFHDHIRENLIALCRDLSCSEVAGTSFRTGLSPFDDKCFSD